MIEPDNNIITDPPAFLTVALAASSSTDEKKNVWKYHPIFINLQWRNILYFYLSMRSLRRDECCASTAWWYISLCPSTTRTSWDMKMWTWSKLYCCILSSRIIKTYIWVKLIDNAPRFKLHDGWMARDHPSGANSEKIPQGQTIPLNKYNNSQTIPLVVLPNLIPS